MGIAPPGTSMFSHAFEGWVPVLQELILMMDMLCSVISTGKSIFLLFFQLSYIFLSGANEVKIRPAPVS